MSSSSHLDWRVVTDCECSVRGPAALSNEHQQLLILPLVLLFLPYSAKEWPFQLA